MDLVPTDIAIEVLEPLVPSAKSSFTTTLYAAKDEIRISLKASTIDGVFATLFSNVTGGVLLTSFLLELGASQTEIGLLAAVPMVANLMQPIGAYFSEQTTSRHYYCLWVYSISRSLWVGLAIAIFLVGENHNAPTILISTTLGIALLSGCLGSLGSAPWLSWMTVIVPRSLRGRYFGLRNSIANLTNLLSVPLMGFAVSRWRGGLVQGYGWMLLLGVMFGLISLWFQNSMVDVNPQVGKQLSISTMSTAVVGGELVDRSLLSSEPLMGCWQDANFLKFLLYSGLWAFSVSLSAPFFTVYMLQDLALDISYVTLYNSFAAGVNLLMLMFWGKLSDQIGNRPILVGVGIVFAVWPLLWLIIRHDSWSIWIWLPLLHIISGVAMAAIELCSNNLQLAIAPYQNQSTYFGIVAAVAGVSGTLGATIGGSWSQFGDSGLIGLFVFSALLRLGALLPLLLVNETPAH
jgi:MFS family permease